MEFTSKNDFFLKFMPICEKEKEITDYSLVESSENFYNIINVKPEEIIGKRISEIILEYNHILRLEDYYFSNIRKSGRKFEIYREESDTWYFINIYRYNINRGRTKKAKARYFR